MPLPHSSPSSPAAPSSLSSSEREAVCADVMAEAMALLDADAPEQVRVCVCGGGEVAGEG